MILDLNTPGLAAELINRLKTEFAETCAANFALDILCDRQQAQIRELQEERAALVEANTNLRNDLELVRVDRDKLSIQLGQRTHATRVRPKQAVE